MSMTTLYAQQHGAKDQYLLETSGKLQKTNKSDQKAYHKDK